MQGISKLINLNGVVKNGTASVILDIIFGESCIILSDISKIFGLGSGIPCPLVGFKFVVPDRVTLLDFSYSEAPYLNRASIVNGYIKNNTRFTLRAIKPILKLSFSENYATNELLYYLMEKYITAGGMFNIVTAWGSFNNCLCEKFEGVKLGDKDAGGQGFDFSFVKVNIPSSAITNATSNYLSNITAGIAV